MIGFTSVWTNDMEKATAFYDSLLGNLGAKKTIDIGRFAVWMNESGVGWVALSTPFDGKEASVGNGVMIALAAKSQEHVDELYAKALELGATDEGKPGERIPGFYAAYFRDLDGNKLNFFHM